MNSEATYSSSFPVSHRPDFLPSSHLALLCSTEVESSCVILQLCNVPSSGGSAKGPPPCPSVIPSG